MHAGKQDLKIGISGSRKLHQECCPFLNVGSPFLSNVTKSHTMIDAHYGEQEWLELYLCSVIRCCGGELIGGQPHFDFPIAVFVGTTKFVSCHFNCKPRKGNHERDCRSARLLEGCREV